MSRKSGSSILLAAAGAAAIGLFATARPAAAHGFGYGYGPQVGVRFYGPPVPYYRPYRPVRVFVAFPFPHFEYRRPYYRSHLRPYGGFHHRYRDRYGYGRGYGRY